MLSEGTPSSFSSLKCNAFCCGNTVFAVEAATVETQRELLFELLQHIDAGRWSFDS